MNKIKKARTIQEREEKILADAMALAHLIYDIYQDKKALPDNRDEKE